MLPDRRYVTIEQRTGLTFEGNGVIFRTVTDGTEFAQPRTRAHWRLVHSTDIIIRNLTIDGPNAAGVYAPDLEAQHGFEIDGGVRVTITDATVSEVYGDGVNVARSFGSKKDLLPQRDSEDVRIEDSTFQLIGRQGLSVTSARRVTIVGNTLTGAARSAVDIEPTGAGNVIEDVVIDSNSFSGYGNYLVAGGGACATTFRNITIVGNTAVGAGPRVGKLGCPHRFNLIIEDNTMTIPAFEGNQEMLIAKFSGIIIRGNVLTLTQSVPGVNLQADIGSILIQDNQFCGAEVVYISDDDTGSVTEQGNDLVC